MASLEYDPSCSALYIRLKRGKAAVTEPLADNLFLDLNDKKEIIGIELLGPGLIDIKKIAAPVRVLSKIRTAK